MIQFLASVRTMMNDDHCFIIVQNLLKDLSFMNERTRNITQIKGTIKCVQRVRKVRIPWRKMKVKSSK